MAMKKIVSTISKPERNEAMRIGRINNKLQAAKIVVGSVNRMYKSEIINKEEARSILREAGLLPPIN